MPDLKAQVPNSSAPITQRTGQKDAVAHGLLVNETWLQFFNRLARLVNSAVSTVVVATLGALDGDGSVGSPLAVRVDGDTIEITPGNQLHALKAAFLPVYTVDPSSPADDTAWILRDGGTPETYYFKTRRAGVTLQLPLGTPLP